MNARAEPPRCDGVTKRGTQCQVSNDLELRGDRWLCRVHDPARQAANNEALARATAASVKSRRRVAAPAAPWPLTDENGKPRSIASLDDCMTVHAWIAMEVTSGGLSWKQAHELTLAVSRWADDYAKSTLANKLQALEAMLEQLRKRQNGGHDLAARLMAAEQTAAEQMLGQKKAKAP